MKKIKLFDTTMRDGEQGIGHLLDDEQKMKLLKQLVDKKIDTIELGMITGQAEHALFLNAAEFVSHQRVAALCRLHEKDIERTVSVLNCFDDSVINLLCIGSEIHLDKKMDMSKADGLRLIESSIETIKSLQFKGAIQAILEDATRGSLKLLHETVETLVNNGVYHICFADTTGAYTPMQTKKLFEHFVEIYPDVAFSCHFHNDLGLAVANTIMAIECGVQEIQVTIGGVGERCGNAALEEVVAILECSEHYANRFQVNTNLKDIIGICQFYYELLDKKPHDKKPLIGEYAFTTCAGIHQSAIVKFPETYEYINPEDFGLERKFVFNRLSSSKLNKCNSNRGEMR